MGVQLNIREFPEELHHELKIRAAIDKLSMKELIIRYCQEGLARDKKEEK